MSEFKDKKALNAMTRARTCLVVAQPFFGCLSLQLELVEVTDEAQVMAIWGSKTGTMAVDGKHLYYHPPFVLGLKDPEVIGVIAHEVMHCAYKHMIRRGHRDPIIYNMAGDFVINADLKKANFVLPGPEINMASKPGTTGHLFDAKFDGMGTEEVYERLIQNVKKVKIFISAGGNDPGGCGAVIDAKGSGRGDKEGNQPGHGLSEADVATLEADWDANVRMAVAVAKRSNAGNVPGHLERLVGELNKPRIDWRKELMDFTSTCMTKDFSWSRPHRRTAAWGVLLPGFISDGMQKLICVMDVSGSVSLEMMQQWGGECMSMLDNGICDVMVLIYTDTVVQKVEEYLRGDVLKITTTGGGGTHFDAVMKYIREEHDDAQAIVFLTDMLTGSFGQDPDIPTLWGATLPHSHLKTITVPFGRVVEVDGRD